MFTIPIESPEVSLWSASAKHQKERGEENIKTTFAFSDRLGSLSLSELPVNNGKGSTFSQSIFSLFLFLSVSRRLDRAQPNRRQKKFRNPKRFSALVSHRAHKKKP